MNREEREELEDMRHEVGELYSAARLLAWVGVAYMIYKFLQ